MSPPYVSYKSLRNFLDSFRQGLPSHVDRSLMKSLSGALQSQLLSALRSLQLIEEDGTVTSMFAALVTAEETEKQKLLRQILERSYPYLFEDFDLERTTLRQFEQRFREQGVTGETVRRCCLFFIQAANEAGIPLSTFIREPARIGKATSNGKSRVEKARSADLVSNTDNLEVPEEISAPSLKEKILFKLTDKLPDYDPNWSPEVQTKWFEAFTQFNQQLMALSQESEE